MPRSSKSLFRQYGGSWVRLPGVPAKNGAWFPAPDKSGSGRDSQAFPLRYLQRIFYKAAYLTYSIKKHITPSITCAGL